MSKYQDLCHTLEQTRQEWKNFKEQCMRLSEQLVHGFIHYLDVPAGRWRLLPPDVAPEHMDLPYSMANVMRLTAEGNWIFLLQIDLLASQGETPTLQPMLFPIRIGKQTMGSTEFEVCLAEKTCRTMHDGLPTEFTELFEAAYQLIVHELDQQLDSFLADAQTLAPRKIGFV